VIIDLKIKNNNHSRAIYRGFGKVGAVKAWAKSELDLKSTELS